MTTHPIDDGPDGFRFALLKLASHFTRLAGTLRAVAGTDDARPTLEHIIRDDLPQWEDVLPRVGVGVARLESAALDDAVTTGTHARSVDIGVKARHAGEALLALEAELHNPDGPDLHPLTDRLAELGGWFGLAADELSVAQDIQLVQTSPRPTVSALAYAVNLLLAVLSDAGRAWHDWGKPCAEDFDADRDIPPAVQAVRDAMEACERAGEWPDLPNGDPARPDQLAETLRFLTPTWGLSARPEADFTELVKRVEIAREHLTGNVSRWDVVPNASRPIAAIPPERGGTNPAPGQHKSRVKPTSATQSHTQSSTTGGPTSPELCPETPAREGEDHDRYPVSPGGTTKERIALRIEDLRECPGFERDARAACDLMFQRHAEYCQMRRDRSRKVWGRYPPGTPGGARKRNEMRRGMEDDEPVNPAVLSIGNIERLPEDERLRHYLFVASCLRDDQIEANPIVPIPVHDQSAPDGIDWKAMKPDAVRSILIERRAKIEPAEAEAIVRLLEKRYEPAPSTDAGGGGGEEAPALTPGHYECLRVMQTHPRDLWLVTQVASGRTDATNRGRTGLLLKDLTHPGLGWVDQLGPKRGYRLTAAGREYKIPADRLPASA